MDIESLIIGAIIGIIMTNALNQNERIKKPQRIKADCIYTYLLQLYVLTIFIAIFANNVEQKIYDFVTLGRFGYNVYNNSRFWYMYMSKPFALLIFIIIAYWYIFIFYRRAKKMFGTHKAIIYYNIYTVLVFIVSALIVNSKVFFGIEFEQSNIVLLTIFTAVVLAAFLFILEIINFSKENNEWL